MSRLRTATIIVTAFAVLIAGQAGAMAKSPDKDDFIAGPDPVEFLKVLTAMTELELRNRNQIAFVEVPGARGRIEGVMLVERISPGQMSYNMVERLQGANALEVFNALTPRGTEYPETLLRLYGRPALGPQGWAMDEMAYNEPGTGKSIPCPSWGVDAFNAALNYGMNNFNNSFKSTFDGPNAKPNHWHKPANGGLGNGVETKDLYGHAFNVTAFSSAVVLCHTDGKNTVGGVYAGNFVNIKYRGSGVSGWALYESGQLDEKGKVVSAQFSPAGWIHPNATEYDLRLEIKNAEMNDLFHIGATWNTKITDIVIKK